MLAILDIYNSRNFSILLNGHPLNTALLSTTVEIFLYYLTYVDSDAT